MHCCVPVGHIFFVFSFPFYAYTVGYAVETRVKNTVKSYAYAYSCMSLLPNHISVIHVIAEFKNCISTAGICGTLSLHNQCALFVS